MRGDCSHLFFPAFSAFPAANSCFLLSGVQCCSMATDYEAVVRNLLDFYDFEGKRVIDVGAGGGQLIGYARVVRSVLAVDNDAAALKTLGERLRAAALEDKFECRLADFLHVRDGEGADVVLFEFSLHEIPGPAEALAHALELAPDVVVMDHRPDSAWAWFVCEEDKARDAWRAIDERHPHDVVVRTRYVDCEQFFHDFGELAAKVGPRGLSHCGASPGTATAANSGSRCATALR